MERIHFVILFILIIITTSRSDIIQNSKKLVNNKKCFAEKLFAINKFYIGKSGKLILCLKSEDRNENKS